MDMKPVIRPLVGCCARWKSRNGWTLKEMSQRTSIPVSTLSKVEHDQLARSL